MIIAIDAHMLGDHSGGNESYYTNILKCMTVRDEDTVYLFVKPGIDVSEFEDRFKIVRFKEENSFKRNFIELDKLCREYKVDVLHTQYFIPFIRSCKIVVTIHDICFEHYSNIFTKKEYITQKLLIPYAAKHSEYVFTVSEHARADIIEHYHLRPEKVIVTYNAVNSGFRRLSEDELKEEELRKKFEIGNFDYILSVGNLQPRKNLVRLIEAFNKWKSKTKADSRLVIVGKKAWMFDGILKAAIEGSKDIIFTDYVSNEDLVRLYNAAKCFVYPSFFEGFGIPPLEAMACGTPVAVANTTSLPEVVGDAGIYFDPFNVDEIEMAIEKMMSDEGLNNKYAELGMKQSRKFSWKDSADIIMETYHR